MLCVCSNPVWEWKLVKLFVSSNWPSWEHVSWKLFPNASRFRTKSLLRYHITEWAVQRSQSYDVLCSRRWAPTSYNSNKWPYKWATGVVTLISGVLTPFITWFLKAHLGGIWWKYFQKVLKKDETLGLLHPRKLTCPLKRDYFNRKYIFQSSFFRGYVSFQGEKYSPVFFSTWGEVTRCFIICYF